MRLHVVGGGPAALYFALLARRRDGRHEVVVAERDGPDDTFGWGIVFSDRTLAFLREHDEPTYAQITAASQSWEHVVVVHRGETVAVRGNGFSGISRLGLLGILRRRCRELGVELRFHDEVRDPRAWLDCDLLVGADGANSAVRRAWSEAFQPSVDLRKNRYVWLGTAQPFHGLVMIFREAEAGLFIAHAYRFSNALSTFIVECPPDTWARSGLEEMAPDDAAAYLARVFAPDLGGHPLLTNNFMRWLNFPLVKTKQWYHRHVVLVGDAAHTAHFSIGSGTKLALEDAIALDRALGEHGTVAAALPAYERARKPVVDAFQEAALKSLLWL